MSDNLAELIGIHAIAASDAILDVDELDPIGAADRLIAIAQAHALTALALAKAIEHAVRD